jgi:hypothetical protein
MCRNILIVFLVLLHSDLARETKMLLVLNRHGARYSYGKHEDKAKEMRITQNGVRMGYILGKNLRTKYPEFFPPKFVNQENYIAASTPSRTQMTAQAIMIGLYDKGSLDTKITVDDRFARPDWKGSNVPKPEFDTPLPHGFQPFPIRAAAEPDNTMLNPYGAKICPKIYPIEKRLVTVYTQKLLQEINAFLPKLNTAEFDYKKIANATVLEWADDFGKISDYLLTRKFLGQDLGVKPELYDRAQKLQTAQLLASYFSREDLTRFQITELTRFMADSIDKSTQKIEEKKPHAKFFLFSAHDLNIVNYLLVTDNFSKKCFSSESFSVDDCIEMPGFASAIVWEVYQENGELLVESTLNGKSIKICGGKSPCPVKEFVAELRNLGLPGPMDSLIESYCRDSARKENNWLVVLLGFNVAVIAVLAGFILHFKKKINAL